MKTILFATALALSATPLYSGGMAEPVTDTEVIVEDTGSSEGDNWVGVLLLLAVVGAVASN